MKHCPICNKEVDIYSETDIEQPFTHYDPMLGLDLWGPFDSHKEVFCESSEFVHFITNGEKRLVKLNCQEETCEESNELPPQVYDPNDIPF